MDSQKSFTLDPTEFAALEALYDATDGKNW